MKAFLCLILVFAGVVLAQNQNVEFSFQGVVEDVPQCCGDRREFFTLWHTLQTNSTCEAAAMEVFSNANLNFQPHITQKTLPEIFQEHTDAAWSGDGPNALLTNTMGLKKWVEDCVIAPWSFDTELLAALPQWALAQASYQGRYWQLPIWSETTVLYFNKELFGDTPPATLEELVAAVEAGQKIVINLDPSVLFGLFAGPQVFGTGQCVVNAETIDALVLLRQLLRNTASVSFWDDCNKQFEQGAATFILDSSNKLGYYAAELFDAEWYLGVAPVPAGTGNTAPLADTVGVFLNSRKVRQSAVDFANYISSRGAAYTWLNTGAKPILRSGLGQPFSKTPEWIETIQAQANAGFPVPRTDNFLGSADGSSPGFQAAFAPLIEQLRLFATSDADVPGLLRSACGCMNGDLTQCL